MERKINKEIREYREAMFWGLTLRQFLFSVLGLGISVGIYFLLRGRLGMEAVSWACIFGMLPCAMLGFVTTGQMPQVGTKFGRWLDLTFMQLQLDERSDPDAIP